MVPKLVVPMVTGTWNISMNSRKKMDRALPYPIISNTITNWAADQSINQSINQPINQ